MIPGTVSVSSVHLAAAGSATSSQLLRMEQLPIDMLHLLPVLAPVAASSPQSPGTGLAYAGLAR